MTQSEATQLVLASTSRYRKELLGSSAEHLDTHVLTMRALERDALERYVARDKPLDCAGSYMIEAGGIPLAMLRRPSCART